ncbi:tyrosine-type recombinase/integrase [Gracilibacillus alcaliphilus]|uniref:tyrosine-type recombinase/integrase n=1 Tax=Gracilibacillus alcaliphilus TaxID=1401441 RepID=UPI00195E2FBB|nr:tyrosine-type recombinase/integrase [Gracilibacillus alcaliphilus]MBM7678038.1 site-specific recombinase XerD [Gracilibacillus alcaliphilus]
MNKTFPSMLEYFVVSYVKNEAGMSPETLRSYYTAIEQFVLWLKKSQTLQIEDINVIHFDKSYIRMFLSYIETEKSVSISTRNQRRAGIVAFLSFAADINPVYANAYLNAKDIKIKKAPKPKKDFLTIEEYQAILESINISTDAGYKHFILINVMYDTAARVDETVRMNLKDFSFGKENSVVIFGKGSKYRRVYLTKHTVKLMKQFRQKFLLENGALFRNRCGDRISDSGIDYILKKYALAASEKLDSLTNKTVSSHMLRRSKATHMLLNGASLPVIQRFLGHESIQTTEAYLEIGSDAMMKAVEAAGNLIFKDNAEEPIASWKDPEILKKLKGLIK